MRLIFSPVWLRKSRVSSFASLMHWLFFPTGIAYRSWTMPADLLTKRKFPVNCPRRLSVMPSGALGNTSQLSPSTRQERPVVPEAEPADSFISTTSERFPLGDETDQGPLP